MFWFLQLVQAKGPGPAWLTTSQLLWSAVHGMGGLGHPRCTAGSFRLNPLGVEVAWGHRKHLSIFKN